MGFHMWFDGLSWCENAKSMQVTFALRAHCGQDVRVPRYQLPLSALKKSGYVASDWPRYCGRKPKRITWPLPIVTSTRAALPLMRSPPNNQPDSKGFLSLG